MTTPPTDGDFTPPEIAEITALLPGYEVLSFIAKGGMGAVYHARQISLDRDVAIKVLPRHFGADASFRTSFSTEAKSMAKFNHPNLIGIFDFGQVDGMLYIIMELVKGDSLYEHAYGKTFDPAECTRIVTGICDGLASAHNHGILHRDIKPANILLGPDLSPKIGDFGLARQVGEHESDSAFGTPGYTASEVIHDPKAVDESTDLYALGVILYELLTGKIPDEIYTNAATLVGCDPAYDQIIRKAMHPSPSMRFRKAADFSAALKKVPTKKGPVLLTAGASKKITAGAPKQLIGANQSAPRRQLNSTSRPPVRASAGGNGPFIRNIIIIIALLATIYIAWEKVKHTRENREDEQAEVDAAREADRTEKQEQRKSAVASSKQGTRPINKQPPAPPTPHVDGPMKTLAKLKEEIVRGNRTQLPPTSFTKGGRARMFVWKPMTWHKAQQYCEENGGHLAVIKDNTELQWLSSKLNENQTVWLGAGSAGKNLWSWIDGSPWTLDIRNTSKAAYVSVDNTGILMPASNTMKHSFFIEWHLDGSTPANLKKQLRRCAQTLTSDEPAFPAGTITYDNRHYLLVERKGNWQHALNLAHMSGGTLATPSTADEHIWMIEFIGKYIPKQQSCWFGTFRPTHGEWQCANGEPWKFSNWRPKNPNINIPDIIAAGTIRADKLWDDRRAKAQIAHFLIEWSNDGDGYTPSTETGTSSVTTTENLGTNEKLTTLQSKCVTLLKDIQTKYEKLITSNIKSYEFDLNTHLRSLTKSQFENVSPGVNIMMASYTNNRIPATIPRDNMPVKVANILDNRLARQDSLELQMLAEIEKIRLAYRKNLQTIQEEFSANNEKLKARQMANELKKTSADAKSFSRYILSKS